LLLKVLTSLDEAYVAAGLKEGKAWAKYSFKGQSPKELSLRKVNPVTLTKPEWLCMLLGCAG